MIGFLARRAGQSLAVVFLVATATFVLIHLAPGDPFTWLENPAVTDELRARWRAAYGLDRPLPEQYVRWLGGLARGDLGWSFYLNRPVADVLREAIPRTLLLMGIALTAAFALGIAVGVLQALKRDSWFERIATAVTLILYSIPEFWFAILALMLFAYWIPILPAGGMTDPVMHEYLGTWGRFVDRAQHLVLPAGTLALLTAAAIARYQRSALLEVAGEDYVRTARAKGVSRRGVIVRHALRNALLPVITLIGLAFPALLAGAVFVERIFGWPGMGFVALTAVSTRDHSVVLATVIVGAIMVTLGSLIADVLYAIADPRMRRTA